MTSPDTDATMLALMADAERHKDEAESWRKHSMTGLRIMTRYSDRLDAIADLHQPEHDRHPRWCRECFDFWPCTSYRLATEDR